MKAVSKLINVPANVLIPGGAAHLTQAHLMEKIQELWKIINLHNYGEISRVRNQIKENKVRINQLMRDNLFELDVNSHE